MDKFQDAISIIGDITTILQAVIKATQSTPHVDIKDLLPNTLLTTLAKTAAELKAKEKFDEQ